MKIFVVDTHALVWFLSNDKRLSPQVGDILESTEVCLLIPTIVLAEVTHLYRKGRITSPLEKVWQFLQKDSRCIIYPIDFNVVLKMPVNLDIHDGLIVGTALAYPTEVTGILTCDEMIAQCGLVPVVW